MNVTLFLTMIVIGFAIAAPIGPVGLICIRKAFAHSRNAAWVAGLGAAMADTLFGVTVGLGVGILRHLIEQYTTILTLVGAIFLLVLGFRTLVQEGVNADQAATPKLSLWRDFLSTFLITLTNPATILGVVGIFAAFGPAAQPQSLSEGWIVLLGVFIGSALWWALLTEITLWAKGRFQNAQIHIINKVSGFLLVIFGLVALAGWLYRMIST